MFKITEKLMSNSLHPCEGNEEICCSNI